MENKLNGKEFVSAALQWHKEKQMNPGMYENVQGQKLAEFNQRAKEKARIKSNKKYHDEAEWRRSGEWENLYKNMGVKPDYDAYLRGDYK